MLNGVSIYADVEDAIAAYKKSDYEGAGQKLGDAVHKTVIGDDIKPPVEEVQMEM